VVYHHLRPVQTCHDEMPTPRAIYRYFRDTGDVAVDTLFFSLADHLATRGYTLDIANWRWHNSLIRYILEQHKQQQNKARPPRLISGHDIMQAFGLQPGYTIGRLLEAVREAQATGKVASREQALAYVNKLLNEDNPAYHNGN
jgi:poly(A) polymerase